MSKAEPPSPKKDKNHKNVRIPWFVTIFFVTIVVSGLISFASDALMEASGLAVAFLVLFVIILLGIVFDMIGVAVTSAEERPFHSMAAKKIPAAMECISLLRSADRVSSICNDVVGDICGVVSGAAAANISAQLVAKTGFSSLSVVSLFLSALVAGLTVGGKALGKTFAMRSSTKVVLMAGKVIYGVRHFPKSLLPKGKKNAGSGSKKHK